MKTIINLGEAIASSISSRDIISSKIKKLILSADTEIVYLSFKEVDFVSRSAAHEFLLLKDNLLNNKIHVYFSYLNKSVKQMFEVVERSRKKKTKIIKFKAEHLDINDLQKVAF